MNYTTTFVDIQMRSACTKPCNSLLYHTCTLKLDLASSNQIQLVPTNQSDWYKALTALLEIPTVSQLFIDTDEMHHMPMMEKFHCPCQNNLCAKLNA